MKTTKLFAALGMAAALFTGCSSDESTTDQGTTPKGITVDVEYSTDSTTNVTPAKSSMAAYDEEKGGVPVSLFDPQWSAQGANTRMTHDDYGTGNFLWEESDKLGVMYMSSASNAPRYLDYLALTSGKGENVATFARRLTLSITSGFVGFGVFFPYETKYGVTTCEAPGSNATKQYIDADQLDGKGWQNYAFAAGSQVTMITSMSDAIKKITLLSDNLQHKNTYVKFTVRSGNGTYVGKKVKSIKIEAPTTIAGTCWFAPNGLRSWLSGTESTSVTLSSEDAFQGTIAATSTHSGDYKYNTAYSAEGSMMVIKAGSFTPVITVTLTDGTELQRTMTNAIDFKAGYLRIVSLNLDSFTNTATKTVKFVSNNTTYGTISQPTLYGTADPSFSTATATNGWEVSATLATTIAYVKPQPATGYKLDSWTAPDGSEIKVGTAINTSNYIIAASGVLYCKIAPYDGGTWTANFVIAPKTMNFVSNNTAYGTVNEPYAYPSGTFDATAITNGWKATTTSASIYALAGVSPATGYRLDSWTTPSGTEIKIKWQNVTSNSTEQYMVAKVDEKDGELIGGALTASIAYYDGKIWTANFRPFAKVVSSDINKGTVPTPTVEAPILAEVWTINAGSRYYINSSSSNFTYGHVAVPTPASGYTFTGWTVSGAAASANNGTFAFGTLKYVEGIYTINTDGSIVTNTNATGGITFTANFALL